MSSSVTVRDIIHVVADDKFIDAAYRQFEEAAPGRNRFGILGPPRPLEFVRQAPVEFWSTADLKGCLADSGANVVIMHSMNARLLKIVPDSVRVLWIGWGFDYYGNLLRSAYPDGLLLAETQALVEARHTLPRRIASQIGRFFGSGASELARNGLAWIWPSRKRMSRRLLGRVDWFAPVLFTEYELARDLNPWFRAGFVDWNYGTASDELRLPGTDPSFSSGSNESVLVGNSAEPSNNHLEAFRYINERYELGDREIIVPLSYGQDWYRRIVIEEGRKLFGDRLTPLTRFLDRDEYFRILDRCGYAFMNHLRQQGLGNTCALLLSGARVFLNIQSPACGFFREEGATVDLIDDPSLKEVQPFVPLSDEERSVNRDVILKHWGDDAQTRKTLGLIQTIGG